MLRRLVDFSLENRPLVLMAAVLVVLGGGYALTQLPIDAVPDITNVQVQVLTKAPALGPVEMEQFVTYPIEAAMNGLSRLAQIRSISRYGLSAVTVVFEDGVDVYFARQLVAERLVQAREAIPEGLGNPEMGPVTTGLGDVFQFTVEGEGVSAMERRTVLDWMIAPRLRAVPGVTEVNTWGGLPKQYQVVVDPAKLRAHGLSLEDVFEAVARGSMNAGGGYIEHNREQYIVRGEGLVGSLADIEEIVLKAEGEGTPITVGNVAQVREGAMLRIGVATADGRGETVIGLVQMLAGENALQVATRARLAVEELQSTLPKGVRIVPYYDRAAFVRRVIRTVENDLVEGVFVTYRVADQAVDDFYASLRGLGEARLAEVQQIAHAFVQKRGRLEAIDKHRLIERIRAGEVIVLDVRPTEEYRAAHIAGAVSLPLEELEKRLGGLPTEQDIVAYCRGPYCVLAPEAVSLLRARGYRAVALGDGVAEWRAQGLPVVVGDAP